MGNQKSGKNEMFWGIGFHEGFIFTIRFVNICILMELMSH